MESVTKEVPELKKISGTSVSPGLELSKTSELKWTGTSETTSFENGVSLELSMEIDAFTDDQITKMPRPEVSLNEESMKLFPWNARGQSETVTMEIAQTEKKQENRGIIDAETKDLILEIVNCYFIPIVCPFGVVGNLLSLVVLLCVHKGKSATTVLLVSLTFADLGYLVTTLMRKLSCVGSKIDPERGWWLDVLFLPQGYMLNRAFNHVTSFTTMAISLERFVAVVWPFKRVLQSILKNWARIDKKGKNDNYVQFRANVGVKLLTCQQATGEEIGQKKLPTMGFELRNLRSGDQPSTI
ncbi:hypothetical protein EGW08_007560 [Elysia chlorotica]|uniref:G-protein coupled receptors family 1 profile domain-containing protein n=1 Tax=Elysia chlorotica TaxID=188477 RepID=A0A3S0ZSD7_ELYCH|nr:hypothetical protein EGW08_007560 [Elysia chlorotica]